MQNSIKKETIGRKRGKKPMKRLIKVPIGNEILKEKSISIELLIKFQIESKFIDSQGKSCVNVLEVNYTRWAKTLGISVNTLKKNLKQLISSGLLTKYVGEDDKEYYRICPEYKGAEAFIEEDILEELIAIKVKYLVKAYLIYYKYTKAYGGCMLIQDEIIRKIGLSSKSSNNKTVLKRINDKLLKSDLIRMSKICKHERRKTRVRIKISTC